MNDERNRRPLRLRVQVAPAARRAPASFLAAYPGASFEGVTRENYLGYLGV